MYVKPQDRQAGSIFDVIPKAVDEYHQQHLRTTWAAVEQQLATTRYHIPTRLCPKARLVVPFAMLLNLVSVSGAEK